MPMTPPRTRADRVAWFIRKFGPSMTPMIARWTDTELRRAFTTVWADGAQRPDWDASTAPDPRCIHCQQPIRAHWTCGCSDDDGGPCFDTDDCADRHPERPMPSASESVTNRDAKLVRNTPPGKNVDRAQLHVQQRLHG
jgi:hypothetical protein